MSKLTIVNVSLILVFACTSQSLAEKKQNKEKRRDAIVGATEKLNKALSQKISVKAVEAPLADVAKDLAKQMNVTIILDHRALDLVGIGEDTPITRNLSGVSLRSTLRLMLRELELTYMLRDGAIVITTPEEAASLLQTRVFDVLDLVRIKKSDREALYDYDSLIGLITTIVEPSSWDEVGGPASIDAFRGTLVISQTDPIQKQIEQLLGSIRKARKIAKAHANTEPPEPSVLLTPNEVRAFRRRLEQRGDFDFREEPLSGVATKISKGFKVNVQLDTRALDLVGIGAETPITFTARDLTLKHVLKHILHELELAYVFTDGVLLITPIEEAEAYLEPRLYPVLDLIDIRPSQSPFDFESLGQLTMSMIAPETWDEVGGAGSVEAMPSFGILAVSQTESVHQQVEDLLAKLRKKVARVSSPKDQKKNPDKASNTATGMRLAVYAVQRTSVPQRNAAGQKTANVAQFGGGMGGRSANLEPIDARELLDIIKELVEPEKWNEKGTYARAAGGRLIIRHTEEVHKQIEELATRLGLSGFHEVRGVQPAMGGGFF